MYNSWNQNSDQVPTEMLNPMKLVRINKYTIIMTSNLLKHRQKILFFFCLFSYIHFFIHLNEQCVHSVNLQSTISPSLIIPLIRSLPYLLCIHTLSLLVLWVFSVFLLLKVISMRRLCQAEYKIALIEQSPSFCFGERGAIFWVGLTISTRVDFRITFLLVLQTLVPSFPHFV